MDATELLRQRRMNRPQKDDMPEEGPEKEESSPHARQIQLTPEELKSLQGTYQPGEEASCEVKGRISDDGMFDINAVMPEGSNPGPQAEESMGPSRPSVMPY